MTVTITNKEIDGVSVVALDGRIVQGQQRRAQSKALTRQVMGLSKRQTARRSRFSTSTFSVAGCSCWVSA
jgi:hypothetical protein